MKNKKGDIPITILVIGVFTICTLAVLSFFNSSIQIKNSFVGINEMEKINIQIEEYNLGEPLENLETLEENGNIFLYQEKKGFWKSLAFWTKEKILFSVKFTPEK
ncbi:hypothetical protein KAJ87_02550 [Candidatus Pacearchaeota archaeon]|nr:hypothetical protein [Candidatus Pacearchaeota archaeon]